MKNQLFIFLTTLALCLFSACIDDKDDDTVGLPCDPENVTKFDRYISFDGFQSIGGVVVSPDGGYVAVGYSSADDAQIYLIKTDDSENVQWEKILDKIMSMLGVMSLL